MRFFFVITFVLVSLYGFSQNNFVIDGYVQDANSGERLVGAVVKVANTNSAVFTNEFGYFSIHITKKHDSLYLVASYLGYKPQIKILETNKSKTVIFKLHTDNSLDSVIVVAGIAPSQTTNLGNIDIPVSQIKLLPSIGAEPDIIKSIQLLPGVVQGTEGFSNFYVRGGDNDENLILLDGVPIYYVGHLGGFVSVFNTDAIKNVKLVKGGFPARYSGRLSSVLDVRMKDGDMREYHGDFSFGLISTKILYQGPIVKDKSSFIVSFRTLPWNIIMKPFTTLANEGQTFAYNFFDFNAKLNYKINKNNRVFFSVYSGSDKLMLHYSKLYYSDQYLKMNKIWGNRLCALRWNHVLGHNVFMNTTLSYTQYKYSDIFSARNNIDRRSFDYSFISDINDYAFSSVVDYNATGSMQLVVGFYSVYHNFNPGISYIEVVSSDTIQNQASTSFGNSNVLENRFFVENHLKPAKFLKLNLGLNIANYYLLGDTNFSYIEPRFVSTIILTKSFSVKLGYSAMSQSLHLLASNSIGLTPDLWVPSDKDMPPSLSRQYSAGIFSEIKNKTIELSLIAYYKTSNNLITYKEGAVFNGNAELWKYKIETGGTGISYGIEFLSQKKQGKTRGWLSYTYSKSVRRFDNINSGKFYPFKYDRRHSINASVIYRFNEKISFSASWLFGTGYPVTLPVATYSLATDMPFSTTFVDNVNPYSFFMQDIYIYSDRNKYRMRAYHRLDVAINFSKKVKKGTRVWTISVYNLYNRQNPYFYYVRKNDNGTLGIYQQSLFPIIPSVSYSLRF